MKKLFFAIIIFFLSIVPANAFTPPAGCTADAYLTRNNGFGTITIDYFKGSTYSCSETLSKTYEGVTIQAAPLTSLPKNMETINEEFTLNLSQIVSFFAGVLAITAFCMGVNGGRGAT